jgi:trans-aconitate 2-methyltransferase
LSDWNPKDYLGFAAERAQPAMDLIARLPNRTPNVICDLGCGPGNSTALLRQAFPAAAITGVDSSPAMVEAARRAVPDVKFVEADAASWRPAPDTDLVFCNALLQWLPDRDEVISGILLSLARGGTLAVQMPDNLMEPSHLLMRELAESGPWRGKLASAVAARQGLGDERHYYILLQPQSLQVQIWRTTYVHALENHEAIARMLSTTGLKPFLDPLTDSERQAFLAQFVARLADSYPATTDGRVLLRFPRLFLVAVRS